MQHHFNTIIEKFCTGRTSSRLVAALLHRGTLQAATHVACRTTAAVPDAFQDAAPNAVGATAHGALENSTSPFIHVFNYCTVFRTI